MGRRRFLEGTMQAALAAAVAPRLALAGGASRDTRTDASGTAAKSVELDVRDAAFGAVGDGVTKDTAALQMALDRCGVLGGGVVVVPPGTYRTGSIQLRSNCTLRLDDGAVLAGSDDFADYAVTEVRWEGRWIAGHIALVYAIDARNVAIMGPGKIAGSEMTNGRPTKEKPLRPPALIEFLRCDGVHLNGFSTSYHRMWSIHPTASRNIVIEDLTIRSTGGNGDGIDVDSCSQVRISRCDISTGDDCISLKSGRGEEGFTQAMPTEDVTIEDCTMADSIFACIGIGSETSGGIRRVKIARCKFTGAKTFAIYIKSRPGRGAYLEDIRAEELDVSGMMGGFLRFNLLNSGLLGEDPVPGLEGIPQGKNLAFRKVRVTDVPVLVEGASVHPAKLLDGLRLEEISGTCAKGITLANARKVVVKNVRVTGFAGPLLSIANVTGVGLEGATEIAAPKTPDPVPERTEAYKLQ